MIVQRQHNGSLLITDIVDGVYYKQVYYGYSIKDAKNCFRAYVLIGGRDE